MKKTLGILAALTLTTAAITYTDFLRADDDEISHEETESQKSAQKPEWQSAVKEKYQLTDEQMKQMKDKGLSNPQFAIVAQLAKSSGKTIDEVLKMRVDQKMGWGRIAKDLGVPPSEIGHAVSDLRHDINGERKEKRETMRENRRDARETRKENREERRQERQDKHDSKGKGH